MRGRGVFRSSDAPFASWDFHTKVVQKVLMWQRPWSRSPSTLREEAEDLDRLDEDLVRVVSEILQLQHVPFFIAARSRPSTRAATLPPRTLPVV